MGLKLKGVLDVSGQRFYYHLHPLPVYFYHDNVVVLVVEHSTIATTFQFLEIDVFGIFGVLFLGIGRHFGFPEVFFPDISECKRIGQSERTVKNGLVAAKKERMLPHIGAQFKPVVGGLGVIIDGTIIT